MVDPFRRPIPVLLVLAAGYTAVILLRLPWTPAPLYWLLWPLLILLGLAGGWLLHRGSPASRAAGAPDAPAGPVHVAPGESWPLLPRLLLLASGLLLLFVLATLFLDRAAWPVVLLPWLGAMGCLLLGAGILTSFERPPLADKHLHETAGPSANLGRLLLLAIILLAAFLRLYRLDQIPAALFIDETNVALDALRLLERESLSPFATGWYETPNGYAYYMAALFGLLGANLLALKLASLLPAILTVPAVYTLARRMFGLRTGLVAAFLLAVNRWHLTMSRWGWNELMPPLFLTLAGFLLWRGMARQRPLDFAAGGALAGGMLYTYLSSRLALITLLLFLLIWLLGRDQMPRSFPGRLALSGLFCLGLLAVAGPLLVTYASAPETFLNRSQEISILAEIERDESLAPLWRNLGAYGGMFFQRGDPQGRHNLPGTPQADPISGLFLALGLGLALIRWRDRRYRLLLIWLLVNLAGGIFSESLLAPNSYRTLNVVVPVVILAGDTLVRAVTLIGSEFQRLGAGKLANRLVLTLLVAALGGIGLAEVGVYFGRQASSPMVQSSYSIRETRVAREVRAALTEGIDPFVSPNFYPFSPLRFLIWGQQQATGNTPSLKEPPFHRMDPLSDLPLAATNRAARLWLAPDYWPALRYFRRYYPNLSAAMIRGPDENPLYLRLDIPAADRTGLAGLNLTVSSDEGTEYTVVTSGVTVPADMPAGVVLRWQGGIFVPASGVYDFAVSRATIFTVDDTAWTGPRRLAKGLYRFAVAGSPETPPLIRWRTAGTSGWHPVPVEAFFTVGPAEQGLLGLYYEGDSWEIGPVLTRPTPFLLAAWPPDEPLPHPFSARFVGTIQIEEPGLYQFRLHADDGVRLFLDGDLVGESVVPDRPNQIIVQRRLAEGPYPLRIDYFQRGGGSALAFYWQPPGRPESLVPPEVLQPPEER